MIIQHIVPLVDEQAPARLVAEQERALPTLREAGARTQHEVLLQLLAHPRSSDPPPSSAKVRQAFPPLRSALADLIPSGKNLPTLPYLADLFRSVDEHADVVILTNPDICLRSDFYDVVGRLHSRGFAGSITRRTISDLTPGFELLDSLSKDDNDPHPGHDCFFFPPTFVREFVLGDVFLGAPPVGQLLLLNIALQHEAAKILRNTAATFHIGDDRVWLNSDRTYLRDLNALVTRRALKKLRGLHGEEALRTKILSLKLSGLRKLF